MISFYLKSVPFTSIKWTINGVYNVISVQNVSLYIWIRPFAWINLKLYKNYDLSEILCLLLPKISY